MGISKDDRGWAYLRQCLYLGLKMVVEQDSIGEHMYLVKSGRVTNAYDVFAKLRSWDSLYET